MSTASLLIAVSLSHSCSNEHLAVKNDPHFWWGPFEVLIVIVIVIVMTMFNDDNLLVVMALHIAIVVAVFLNNNRILSARRRYWQDKRDRRERRNCQSNITHRSLLVVNGVHAPHHQVA